MTIGNILLKMANNNSLNNDEKTELRLWGEQTQLNNAWLSGIQTPDQLINDLKIKLPFELIYGQTLAADTASIFLNVPPEYSHLIICGNGRSSYANTGVFMTAVFNGDTGNNYARQYVGGKTGASYVGHDTSDPYYQLGGFPGSSSPANYTGTFFCFLPNVRHSFQKMGLSLSGRHADDTDYYTSYLILSEWRSTASIQTLTIGCDLGDMVAGTTISVIGIR